VVRVDGVVIGGSRGAVERLRVAVSGVVVPPGVEQHADFVETFVLGVHDRRLPVVVAGDGLVDDLVIGLPPDERVKAVVVNEFAGAAGVAPQKALLAGGLDFEKSGGGRHVAGRAVRLLRAANVVAPVPQFARVEPYLEDDLTAGLVYVEKAVDRQLPAVGDAREDSLHVRLRVGQ
jgi:hypothetical protein